MAFWRHPAVQLLPIVALAAVLAPSFVSSSSQPRVEPPSPDTRFLEADLIPQLVRWKNGPEPAFAFRDLARRRGYDFICLVGQYHRLEHGLRSVPRVDRYAMNFGGYVPENHTAFVVTRGRAAHAVLVSNYDINIGGVTGRRSCVPAGQAILTHTGRNAPTGSSILLGDGPIPQPIPAPPA